MEPDKTQSSLSSARDDSSLSLSQIYRKEERGSIDVGQLFKEYDERPNVVPPPVPMKTQPSQPALVHRKPKERAVLDQQQFDKQYGYRRVDLSMGRRVQWHFKKVGKWKKRDWLRFVSSRMPIVQWLRRYHWRQWIVADIIGGLMCSIMSVPQGLAYGYMVGVPPNYGLITGIFGPLIYALLGTSKHTSPGSFAIVSLMVGSAVQQYAVEKTINQTDLELEDICCKAKQMEATAEAAVGVATALTLTIGLCQIIFGLLNMGLLAVWLSDHLVQGLTSGAAVHVLTSQLKSITGIKGLPPTNEPFGLPLFYFCFFYNITDVDFASLIVGLVSVALLLFSSYLVDPILKKWTNIKFPMEFLIVAGSVLIVWLSRGTRYHFEIPTVGHVESGIPAPRLPPMQKVGDLIGSAITTSVISFVIHISMAKLIAKKLNYEVDANQEWFALGAMHAFSSFFGCFAGGSSLGRSMTQVKFGTKSQLSTLVCCCILVGCVYGAATLIFYLPKAVLAAIVIVAMKDLYIQLFRSFGLWRESIVDFLIYMVTLFSVILISVMFGLIVGVCFALLSVVFRTQWAESTCMGRIPGTADFKGLGQYRTAEEVPGVKVFRFDAPLYFANAETFIDRMHTAVGVNPLQVRASLEEKVEQEAKKQKKKEKEAGPKAEEEAQKLNGDKPVAIRVKNTVMAEKGKGKEKPKEEKEKEKEKDEEPQDEQQLSHIVIDCSSIPYIDLMGKNALAQVFTDYATVDITVLFSHCKVAVRQMFETTDFYQKVPKNRMFVSLDDAVAQAQKEQQLQRAGGLETKSEAVARKADPKQLLPKAPKALIAPVAHSPAQKTIVEKLLLAQDTQVSQHTLSPSMTAYGMNGNDWYNPTVKEQGSQDSMDKTQ